MMVRPFSKTKVVHNRDLIKEDFQKIFRGNGLNIGIKCNLKIADYLDATLNLLNNSYKTFSTPNNEINYKTHKESNHPPSITKQVPISIESRLSSLSSNEKTFNESAPINQEVLKKSGFNFKLKYQKIPQQQDQNNSVKEK